MCFKEWKRMLPIKYNRETEVKVVREEGVR